jgi:hypothetical protein
MENSTHYKVLLKIARTKRGALIFPADFRMLGNSNAIKTALFRLYKDGKLDRIAQGIYTIPRHDPVLGNLYPSLEEIAQGIARRDRARIMPSGAYALHKLGLSTQVPTKLVFLTDGAPRQVRIGNRSIKFKATTPKKLMTKGKISSLIIQALSELGKDGITPEIEIKLRALLQKEAPQTIKEDAALAPAWISEKMYSFAGLTAEQ